MFHIMIIEDEKLIRNQLSQLLKNALYRVTAVEEFSSVADQVLKTTPDLVLLDMNLPNENGVSICEKVRSVSDVPIIFVTGNNTSMDELNCMLQGADDYISKPYQAPILLARIAAVLKRCAKQETNTDAEITYQNVTLNLAKGQLEYEESSIELTRNEIKILHFLFKHQGEIVSRDDLIEYLWDHKIYIDDNTLSVNVTRIRGKLASIGVRDFIETKRGMGYRI